MTSIPCRSKSVFKLHRLRIRTVRLLQFVRRIFMAASGVSKRNEGKEKDEKCESFHLFSHSPTSLLPSRLRSIRRFNLFARLDEGIFFRRVARRPPPPKKQAKPKRYPKFYQLPLL